MTMETFIEMLKQVFDEPEEKVAYQSEYDDEWYFKDTFALANSAVHYAGELLITENGRCNWENIGKLRDAGFRVFPGESDSFGWLTGCIGKKDRKPIIVYG